MAAPSIKFKRGIQANLPALAAGEPAFVSDEYNFYLGVDGTSGNNKFLGSARYWTKETATTGQSVKLHAKTGAGGGGSVSLKSPDTSTSNTTYTFPATPSDGFFLKTDTNGVLSWAEAGFNITTLTAEAAVADADVFPFYDDTAAANRKVTAANLALYVLQEATGDVTFNSSGVAAIGSGVIVDADINANAEIAVSKLANGTARQLLQTDAAGTGVEWATNIDIPGTLDVTGNATFDSNLTVTGNLTVNGTVTTVATTNTVVKDSLIELANGTTGTPSVDAGLIIERGDSSNIFIGYDEGADLFVAGTTTITGSGSDAAPSPITFLAGAFNVSDLAGTNEAVVGYLALNGLFTGSVAGRYLQNIIVDCGTF